MFNDDQRAQLLRIARQSIEAVFEGRRLELDLGTLDAEIGRAHV